MHDDHNRSSSGAGWTKETTMLRTLRNAAVILLPVAALAVVLAIALSDHSDEYGSVAVPPGGTIHLPEGKVAVFYDEAAASSETTTLQAPLQFTVTPAGGGPALDDEPTANEGNSTSETARSEDFFTQRTVAKVDVPAEGEYVVRAAQGQGFSGTMSFGQTPFAAALKKWKLWVGLLIAAFILSQIPVPRSGKSAPVEQRQDVTGWAGGEDPSAPPPYEA
jgi:hypothetical protein